MPAASASTIARIAAAHARLTLPETATVQRVTRTPADGGGWDESFATVATVAARVGPISGDLQDIADTAAEVSAWALTFPAGTDVQPTDRVLIGARTFTISYVSAPRSFELTRRAIGNETT